MYPPISFSLPQKAPPGLYSLVRDGTPVKEASLICERVIVTFPQMLLNAGNKCIYGTTISSNNSRGSFMQSDAL